MYQRGAILELKRWAQKKDRKPLIIRGARQVGKTTLVNLFSDQFDQYIYLNLERPEDVALFESFSSVKKLIQALFLQKKMVYSSEKTTLIFIDEIQQSPVALSILRYLYEEEPLLYIIAAGSLLESLFNTHVSFPVGRVEYLVVRPVSFAEFLNAIGDSAALQQLTNIPVNDFANDTLFRLFHTYALIGGMPEVVKKYAAHENPANLGDIYNSLLTSYSDDVEKYAVSSSQVQYIRHAMQSVYAAAGSRIKFAGFGNSGYGSREMGEALRILEKAMLLHIIYPQTGATLPLLPDKKKSPRLQVLDTGLMNYSLGIQKDIIGSKNLGNVYRGIMLEHLAGQELIAEQYNSLSGLHFWVREKNTSVAEVDFLISYNGDLIPVEVKSGETGSLRSLHLFMEMAPHQMAVRLYSGELSITPVTTHAGKKYFLLSLPYFLAGQTKNYLPWFEQEIDRLNRGS